MIIPMARIRVVGPRPRLTEVLEVIQDLHLVHPAPPVRSGSLKQLDLDPALRREIRHLQKALRNVELAAGALGLGETDTSAGVLPVSRGTVLRFARQGWKVYRCAKLLSERRKRLEDERWLILKYRDFFETFRPVIESEESWPNAVAYHVFLRSNATDAAAKLRLALQRILGQAFELTERPLPSGEVGAVIVTLSKMAPEVERLLAELGIEDVGIPEAYEGKSLAEAMPRMLERLEDIVGELEQVRRRLEALRREEGPDLLKARAALRDRLQLMEALAMAGATERTFVLEGWAPAAAFPVVSQRLRETLGSEIVITAVSREDWVSAEAPVVLRNPRLFRPFETVVALLPLPRYGSVDPTPFVALFFPAFFGLIVGDIGYGAMMALIGLVLYRKSKPNTLWRNVAEIMGPCSLLSIGGGFLYGECFGDLGQRWFGLRPLFFSREEALVTFLLLAVALGAVHVLTGLILGMLSSIRSHRRQALGRGAAAVTILLIISSLLAAAGLLPREFFTPGVVGILVAFTVLILVEGLLAPVELLSTVGNILSYARIMALGVASLMLAVVANRMVGAIGSVAVGLLFGLSFHLVNFAIALLSPTIHALRLHYVEFFSKFYSPGGVRYQPLGHVANQSIRNASGYSKKELSWK